MVYRPARPWHRWQTRRDHHRCR